MGAGLAKDHKYMVALLEDSNGLILKRLVKKVVDACLRSKLEIY